MFVLGVLVLIVIFIVGYLRVARERIRRVERARSLELLTDRPSIALGTDESRGVQLDPNWEWELVREKGKPDQWVRVRCRHVEVVPVDSLDGTIPAQLCLTCDTQFNVPIEGKGNPAGPDQAP